MEPSRPQPRLDRWTIGEALAYVIKRIAYSIAILAVLFGVMMTGGYGIGGWDFLIVGLGCFLWVVSAVSTALKRSL